jgi:hypothetical protein
MVNQRDLLKGAIRRNSKYHSHDETPATKFSSLADGVTLAAGRAVNESPKLVYEKLTGAFSLAGRFPRPKS